MGLELVKMNLVTYLKCLLVVIEWIYWSFPGLVPSHHSAFMLSHTINFPMEGYDEALQA